MDSILYVVLSAMCIIAYAVGRRHGTGAAIKEAEARRAADLATIRDSASELGVAMFRTMGPEVSREVSSKVEPLVSQVSIALQNYQRALQVGMQGQSERLGEVKQLINTARLATESLAESTNEFTAVLKSAAHRGRWGEQTLRRVLEASNVSPLCDFEEQVSQDDARPDVVIRLPGNRCIIVDAKVPEFDAAIASELEQKRKQLLADHASKLRRTIASLAARKYPAKMRERGLESPNEVVLFLPAESLLSAALEADPEILLEAGKLGVVIATPATLLAMLGAVNMLLQQHRQGENAKEIAVAASELYGRVSVLVGHLEDVRTAFTRASKSLDAAFGSYERKVRPQGKRMQELGIKDASADALPELTPIDFKVRGTSPESSTGG